MTERPQEASRSGASLRDHGGPGSAGSGAPARWAGRIAARVGDEQRALLREMYWARETAARARMLTPEIRDRLHDFAAQMRTDEKVIIPQGEGNLASTSTLAASAEAADVPRCVRPTWRYDRLLADHAELTTSLAERVMALEAEVDRLKAVEAAGHEQRRHRGARRTRMRVAVLHPQTAFVRGGAETHAEALVRALRAAGHEADLVQIAGKWYPPSQLAHQMAVWRSFDITESNGLRVDAVIGLKFPAYLVEHERKIVWLIHQHRTAYELWDHPDYADLKRQEDGAKVRDMVWEADRVALGEAKRVFTNAKNVQRSAVELAADPGRGAVPPEPRRRGAARLDARAARGLPAVPQPHGEPEAAVARDRGDAPREDAACARPGRQGSRRAGASRSGRAARRRRPRVVRDRRDATSACASCTRGARRLLRSVRRGLRLRDDRGVRGRVRSSRSPTAAGRSSSCGRGDRAGVRAEPKAIAEAFDRLLADRDGAARMGSGGQRARARRGAALARHRRAAARLMHPARALRRRLRGAASGRRGRARQRSGSQGDVVFSGPLPPAPTGIATYDAGGAGRPRPHRVRRPHRMDVVWPVEGRRTRAGFPGYRLGVFQLGNNVEFHLEVYRAAYLTSALVVLHDLALDDFVRGLKAAGEPLGLHGGARGGAAARSRHRPRRHPQRAAPRAVVRARRAPRPRDHRALGLLPAIPRGASDAERPSSWCRIP